MATKVKTQSMTAKKCKDGEILRDSYVTSKGVAVKASCIKATSASGKKAKDENAEKIQTMLRKQEIAARVTTSKVPALGCPAGTIRRAAFLRKDGTAVPEECITSRGSDDKPGLINPKTGERIYIIINDQSLHKFGYNDVKHKSAPERHEILDKVYHANDGNWLSLYRTLNYLAVVNKAHKELHDLFQRDRNYIKRKYGLSESALKPK